MNSQQAINLLKGLEQSLDDYCELNDEGKAAFRMAIAALESFGISEQLPSAEPEPCEDAVSRRRLLSDLKELTAAWGKYPVMAEQIKGVETAIGYVETIPSVTPEREKGKWIVYKAPDKYHCGLIKCPFCGEEGIAEADEYNYCPNCGADMRGDQNG